MPTIDPSTAEVKDTEHKIIPIEDGFKFECQQCGRCCKDLNRILTLDEATYFNRHSMDVKYTITILKTNNKVISIYPSKPPQVPCVALYRGWRGLGTTDAMRVNECLIYPKRPTVCQLFPFIIRIYYHRPPTYKEILQSLRMDEKAEINIRIKPYVRKIDDHRWLFLGCQIKANDFCPGIGKGDPWTVYDIDAYVADNLFMFKTTEDDMAETNTMILDNLRINVKDDLAGLFEFEKEIYEDEEVSIGLYEPINARPDHSMGAWKPDYIGSGAMRLD